jgi:ATP-dependent helicase/nuclease subunit A
MYTFSDIIIYALKVLQESASYSPWVLMNLSNTISHILIDEAQDTSPLQWRFLQELTELVFDQELGRKSSLFVVGDFKQSIFSFQGARPEIFNDVYTTLKNALALQGHALEKIDLNTSFRSTPAILNFVDSVFQGELKQGVWEEDSLIHHAHREGEGKIDIFPPCSDPLQAALLIQKIACPDTMILFRR